MIRIRLREILRAKHEAGTSRLTYEDIADRTGLSLTTVQSIGSRQHYNATLETIEKLCLALDCSPGDLLELEE